MLWRTLDSVSLTWTWFLREAESWRLLGMLLKLHSEYPSLCVERREAMVKIIKNVSDCAFPSSRNGSSSLVLLSLLMCLGMDTTFIFFWASPKCLRTQHSQSQMPALLSWDFPPDSPWHCSPGLELRNNLLFSSLLLSNLSW